MQNPIKYPYLPEGKTIQYVSKDNEFMKAAKDTAQNFSTDKLQSTGSIIVKNGKIIGHGANQVPIKNPFLAELHRKGLCVRKLLKVKTGTRYWLCPGCSKWSDHSEQQAVDDANRKGEDIKGGDLYLYGHWWSCKPCWDKMLGAGIENLFLLEDSEVLFNSGDARNILGKQFK